MARFHDLTVTELRRTTRDAVVVTLQPNTAEAGFFRFRQGQYLVFRRKFDGEEIRRSYSICSGVDDDRLQVGIRRVEGGRFSTWANEELRPGMVLRASAPQGMFHTPLNPGAVRTYLGFAGGSGITPILSIIRTVLVRETRSRFFLVYANRSANTIMFREELADIKNHHMDRFSVQHILESDTQEIELFGGRLDATKLDRMFSGWLDVTQAATAFICGPEPMMLAVADGLRRHGVSEERIKFELFANAQPGRTPRRVRVVSEGASRPKVQVAVTLDGVVSSFEMERDKTILDAALGNAVDAPFACKAGVCSTCRCKILEGEVEMASNHALEDYEVAHGYVLSCQAYPLGTRVVVDYDQ